MKYIFRQRKKLAVRWFVIINIEILPFECIFVNGFLKMAACLRSAETNCGSGSDENDIEVQFINEDNLPLACITVLEHPESEGEILFQMIWLKIRQKNRKVKRKNRKETRKKTSRNGAKK